MMDKLESPNLLKCKIIKNDDGSETVHYPVCYEAVPNEYKKFAERDLGEAPEKISRGIKYLKKIIDDKGLPQTDEKYLVAVLRNCKYDLKKSKVKLEKFVKAKKMIAERIADLDFDIVDKILRQAPFTLLPYRDKHGRLILSTRPEFEDLQNHIKDGFVCYFAMLLYTLQFPMTSLNGIVYIAEAKSPSFTLMYQVMKEYKSWFTTILDLPFGLRKIDITNESAVIRFFLNLARPVVPAKIFKRITMHGDSLKTLRESYHPDLLPEDFGGNLGPISSKHYREDLLDFMRELREEHLARVG